MSITANLHNTHRASARHVNNVSWVVFESIDGASINIFCPSAEVAEATARAFTETAATKEKVDV